MINPGKDSNGILGPHILKNSQLYKEHNINISTDWLSTFNDINLNNRQNKLKEDSNTKLN